MKLVYSLFLLLSVSVWAEDGEDQDMEISDQQRCTEWAVMDGIEKEDMADYMQECIASLGYEPEMAEELEE